MLLYLARHAQTASSKVDSFNGQRELSLTPQGLDQAMKLGTRLAGLQFEAVYRSPLGRTLETARAVVPTIEPAALPGLTEISYGEWEGLTADEAREKDPDRFDAWERDPVNVSPPGGETIRQVADRALAAVELIRRQHTGAVLVFSHKATLRALACALLEAPLETYRTQWPQDECALNLFELRAGKPPFLRVWNDTSHLGPDPARTTRGGK